MGVHVRERNPLPDREPFIHSRLSVATDREAVKKGYRLILCRLCSQPAPCSVRVNCHQEQDQLAEQCINNTGTGTVHCTAVDQ